MEAERLLRLALLGEQLLLSCRHRSKFTSTEPSFIQNSCHRPQALLCHRCLQFSRLVEAASLDTTVAKCSPTHHTILGSLWAQTCILLEWGETEATLAEQVAQIEPECRCSSAARMQAARSMALVHAFVDFEVAIDYLDWRNNLLDPLVYSQSRIYYKAAAAPVLVSIKSLHFAGNPSSRASQNCTLALAHLQ